jgi:predicted transcriptional regulator
LTAAARLREISKTSPWQHVGLLKTFLEIHDGTRYFASNNARELIARMFVSLGTSLSYYRTKNWRQTMHSSWTKRSLAYAVIWFQSTEETVQKDVEYVRDISLDVWNVDQILPAPKCMWVSRWEEGTDSKSVTGTDEFMFHVFRKGCEFSTDGMRALQDFSVLLRRMSKRSWPDHKNNCKSVPKGRPQLCEYLRNLSGFVEAFETHWEWLSDTSRYRMPLVFYSSGRAILSI